MTTSTEQADMSEPEDRTKPPPPRRKRRVKSVRTRLSLDLAKLDHANLVELSEWWGKSLHQTVTDSIKIARKFYTLEHPEHLYPNLSPEERPRPGYWERHEPDPTPDDPGREKVHLIEVIPL